MDYSCNTISALKTHELILLSEMEMALLLSTNLKDRQFCVTDPGSTVVAICS